MCMCVLGKPIHTILGPSVIINLAQLASSSVALLADLVIIVVDFVVVNVVVVQPLDKQQIVLPQPCIKYQQQFSDIPCLG